MKLQSLIVACGFAAASMSGVAWAADTTSRAGATGECKDGTYTTSPTHKGACSDHGGVKAWYADKGAAPAPSAPSEGSSKARGKISPESTADNAPSSATARNATRSAATGGGSG